MNEKYQLPLKSLVLYLTLSHLPKIGCGHMRIGQELNLIGRLKLEQYAAMDRFDIRLHPIRQVRVLGVNSQRTLMAIMN